MAKRKRADTVFKKLFFCHNVAPSVNVAIVLSTEVTKNIVVNPLFFHIEKQSCKGVPGLNISPLMVEDISSDAYWATTMAAKNSKGYRTMVDNRCAIYFSAVDTGTVR